MATPSHSMTWAAITAPWSGTRRYAAGSESRDSRDCPVVRGAVYEGIRIQPAWRKARAMLSITWARLRCGESGTLFE